METSVLLSLGTLFGIVVLAVKIGQESGQLKEFKRSVDQRTADVAKEAATFVRRHEMDNLHKHIDQRFDGFERQMQELRGELSHLRAT